MQSVMQAWAKHFLMQIMVVVANFNDASLLQTLVVVDFIGKYSAVVQAVARVAVVMYYIFVIVTDTKQRSGGQDGHMSTALFGSLALPLWR